MVRHSTHPDTGAQIEGVRVPAWDAVVETVETLAAEVPYVPFVGWDVLLSESGEPVVIEANSCPGLASHQVHRPLLDDERLRRILDGYV